HGIWPRPAPTPETSGGVPVSGGIAPPQPGLSALPQVPLPPAPSPPSGAPAFSAEGLLREALIRLWEQARAARVEKIGMLTLRMFDAADAFRLLNVVAAIRGAEQRNAVFEGG